MQFLTASNIDFSDNLKHLRILCYHLRVSNHRRLCWIWCINSYSWKYETGTVITFLFIQMVHGTEILWLVGVFSSDIVISMRLPHSAFIFTAEVWAIIKAPEQIIDSVASKYIIFTDSLSCLQGLQYTKLEHPLIGMVI